MPHQCTSCGYLFEDGSKAMLSGCPDCGGNTFQFHPKGAPIPEIPDDEPPEPEGGTVGDTVGRATNAVRGLVNRGDQPAGAPHDVDAGDTAPSDTAPSDAAPEDAHGPVEPGADPTDQPAADQPATDQPATDQPATDQPTTYGRDADVQRASDIDPGDAAEPAAGSAGAGGTGHAPWPSEQRDTEAREDAAQANARSSTASPADDDGIIDADAREGNVAEDTAQADARKEFVGPDELPSADGEDGGAADAASDSSAGPPGGPPSNGRVVREPTGEQPSLDELRQELNDQFESIKIVNPGEYELNLMELYNREEYVVALQENGRYVIQMPENWMRNRDDD